MDASRTRETQDRTTTAKSRKPVLAGVLGALRAPCEPPPDPIPRAYGETSEDAGLVWLSWRAAVGNPKAARPSLTPPAARVSTRPGKPGPRGPPPPRPSPCSVPHSAPAATTTTLRASASHPREILPGTKRAGPPECACPPRPERWAGGSGGARKGGGTESMGRDSNCACAPAS